jgi:uncharacterized membrane protein
MTRSTNTSSKPYVEHNLQHSMLLVILALIIPFSTSNTAVTLAFQSHYKTLTTSPAQNDRTTCKRIEQTSTLRKLPFITIAATTTSPHHMRLYAATIEDESITTKNKSSDNKEPKKQQQSLSDRIATSSMASAAAVATAAGMYSNSFFIYFTQHGTAGNHSYQYSHFSNIMFLITKFIFFGIQMTKTQYKHIYSQCCGGNEKIRSPRYRKVIRYHGWWWYQQ